MAEKNQKEYQANGYNNVRDQESGAATADQISSRELKKKKRIKCLSYVAAFAVFQTGIILIFALVVMKARTPKFQVRSLAVETFDSRNDNTNNPSFDIRFNARVRVKNTNFGPYKYQNSTIYFFYGNDLVGQVSSPRGKAGFRSSKSFHISVNLSSRNVTDRTQLRNDLSAGAIPLRSESRLQGKAELMWFLYKKRKATSMNCNIVIGTDRGIRSLDCQ